jgi:hypothetical protein
VNPKNAVRLGLKIAARQGDCKQATEQTVAWHEIAIFHDSKRFMMVLSFKHIEIIPKTPTRTLDFRLTKATKVQR